MIKKILVAKEKHGDRYLNASTPEALAESAFKLLKERWEMDYWYHLDDPPSSNEILSEEQISALPTTTLAASEAQKRANYLRRLHAYERQRDTYEAIKDCVENNKKDQAWSLLQRRSNYEYEQVTIETLE